MRYDKVIVRNAFIEYDLDKGKGSHQDGSLRRRIRGASDVHRHRDLSWAARLFAQVRLGTHANAGWPVQATPGTQHGSKRGHVDSALSVFRRAPRSLERQEKETTWLGRTDEDTPVELEDVPVYLGIRQNTSQRCVVQPIDVLGNKGTNNSGELQCSECEMSWVREGAADG